MKEMLENIPEKTLPIEEIKEFVNRIESRGGMASKEEIFVELLGFSEWCKRHLDGKSANDQISAIWFELKRIVKEGFQLKKVYLKTGKTPCIGCQINYNTSGSKYCGICKSERKRAKNNGLCTQCLVRPFHVSSAGLKKNLCTQCYRFNVRKYYNESMKSKGKEYVRQPKGGMERVNIALEECFEKGITPTKELLVEMTKLSMSTINTYCYKNKTLLSTNPKIYKNRLSTREKIEKAVNELKSKGIVITRIGLSNICDVGVNTISNHYDVQTDKFY